jgi:hypothetical protein
MTYMRPDDTPAASAEELASTDAVYVRNLIGRASHRVVTSGEMDSPKIALPRSDVSQYSPPLKYGVGVEVMR